MPPDSDVGPVASYATGELVILWSARTAMMLYVVAVAARLMGRNGIARCAWSAGCFALLIHLASAMHTVHRWNLDAAYAEVARQTAVTYGVDWGGGLYINFLFAAVWLADTCWWWLSPASYLGRSRGFDLAVHAFMAFIVFNAVVVFPTNFIRWLGLAACAALGTLVLRTSKPTI